MIRRYQPHIGVIIVNWNGRRDTLECLNSLQADLYPNKTVLVVDNGSTDGSVEAIRLQFPKVKILETGQNLGFTGGNNAGLSYLSSDDIDFVYLLNNDTTSDPLALSHLVAAYNVMGKSQSLLTPVIHYYDTPEKCWFSGSTIDLRRGTAFHDNSREPLLSDSPFEVPWASGCAMLLPIQLLNSLGGFDDRYYLNWEDVDLSLRARSLGSSIQVVPVARIYHKVGRSFTGISEEGRYYHVRNNLLLLKMHSKKHYNLAALRVVQKNLRENLRQVRRREPKALSGLRATFQAINDHRENRYGARYVRR